jgi:hypothetical protein
MKPGKINTNFLSINLNIFIKVSDFEQLISEKSRIEYFSCGHVIPKENLLTLTLGTSSNGIKFDFSFNSRDNTKIVLISFVLSKELFLQS